MKTPPLPEAIARIETVLDRIQPPALQADIREVLVHLRRQHTRLAIVEQLLTRVQPALDGLVQVKARAVHAADPANGYPFDARAVAQVIAGSAR